MCVLKSENTDTVVFVDIVNGIDYPLIYLANNLKEKCLEEWSVAFAPCVHVAEHEEGLKEKVVTGRKREKYFLLKSN